MAADSPIEFNLQKCVDNATPDEKAKMEQLREIANQWTVEKGYSDEFVKEKESYVDDIALYRYLYGWEWKIEDAEKGLKKTIEWRVSYKPQDVRLKEVESIAKDGWMFHYGKDKIGHPIIWIVVRNDKLKKNEETKELMFRYLVWIMENCLREMKEDDAHRITWIVELKGASLSLGTAKSLKDMFYSLGEYYPERLARCVVLNASWLLNAIWVFAQQFMTKSTIAKYIFIKGSKDSVRKELTKYVDPNELPKDFYGDADWKFDIDALIAADEEKRT